ncbi:alpha-taxilin, partial [Nephila pilipes]
MDSTQENKNNSEINEVSELLQKDMAEPVQELKESKDQQIKNENSPLDDDDDSLDDLHVIDAATSVLDETFSIDDPDLVIPDHLNEAYKNIITVCSTTAQNIRKTINEVLNARQSVIITEVDPTTELQESLNKKIADFEKVVSDYELDNIVEDKIEDGSQNSVHAVNTIKIVAAISEENETFDNSGVKSAEINSEQNFSTVITSTKVSEAASNDTIVKDDVKVSKSNEKKKEMTPEISVEVTKTNSASQMQSSDSLKEILKNFPVTLDDEKLTKKQKNSASKKRGEKNTEQILKSLGNGTAEEKLHLLCKRHIEALEEYRLVEPRLKQLERQITSQQREKEQLQAEHNRMILAKSRLESLCREMQRQSKAVKEESLLRLKAEEIKRRELASKFQITLNDISALMQENSKKNIQLRQENTELATKLKSLVDNYEVWEQ